MSRRSKTEIRGYYAWEIPDDNISIYMDLDLVDLINYEVTEGFESASEPLEVGGLLLARF